MVSTVDALFKHKNSAIPDIEALPESNLEERGRQRFCSALRRFAIQEMPEMVRKDFDERVAPAHKAKGELIRDAVAIEEVMKDEASYRFYSTLRYNAQEMCFQSVQEPIERALPGMIDVAKAAIQRNPAGGSLKLDPSLAIPDYVSQLDVHLTPGCFHSEWVEDDVAQGAVVSLGARVFSASMSHRSWGGVAKVISRWLKHERPDFAPVRILDIGTSSAKNLVPYVEAFPGTEAHGIDVAAPLLRYGHAIAEHEGIALHLSQQNAEALDFPDGHFDLIVSSFFFHEITVDATRKVLKECRRLLRPGGIMVHQEPALSMPGKISSGTGIPSIITSQTIPISGRRTPLSSWKRPVLARPKILPISCLILVPIPTGQRRSAGMSPVARAMARVPGMSSAAAFRPRAIYESQRNARQRPW